MKGGANRVSARAQGLMGVTTMASNLVEGKSIEFISEWLAEYNLS